MKLHFVTTNPGKVHSLKKDLEHCGIEVIQEPIDLIEPRSSDVLEIAESKMKQAFPHINKATIVIDAGFYIDSLNGFPRAFVNFALETVGIEGILDLVKDKPRKCEFRECLAYQDETMLNPEFFLVQVKGTIAASQRGTMDTRLWSKLALIFIPEGEEKTLAEMSHEEYNIRRDRRDEDISLGKNLYKRLVEQKKIS